MLKESLAHLRFDMEDSEVNDPQKGGLTIAYEIGADGCINVGIADCAMEEHYNRKLGTLIARGRLGKKPVNTGYKPTLSEEEEGGAELVAMIISHLLQLKEKRIVSSFQKVMRGKNSVELCYRRSGNKVGKLVENSKNPSGISLW